jgi:hypothetical protein
MINFSLAVFWLVVAIALFSYPLLHPQGAPLDIAGTGIPLAWVAVFFFCYNVLRWWLSRVQRRDRELMRRIARRPHSTEERNPDFDFGEDAENEKRDKK